MSRVTPLNLSGYTPQVILSQAAEHCKDLEEIFIVGFDGNCQPRVWLAGSLSRLALAALLLHQCAARELEPEEVL